MSQGPAAADTQVWMRTPGSASVISPVRRSRTAPALSGVTHPKQMPMRHPEGMSTPASSPTSSNGVAPSASTVLPVALNVTSPPSPVTTMPGRKRSV